MYAREGKREINQNWGDDLYRQWEREESENNFQHHMSMKKMYENAITSPISLLA